MWQSLALCHWSLGWLDQMPLWTCKCKYINNQRQWEDSQLCTWESGEWLLGNLWRTKGNKFIYVKCPYGSLYSMDHKKYYSMNYICLSFDIIGLNTQLQKKVITFCFLMSTYSTFRLGRTQNRVNSCIMCNIL